MGAGESLVCTSVPISAMFKVHTCMCPICIVNFLKLNHDMIFPTEWYVRPAKAHTSLRICAV